MQGSYKFRIYQTTGFEVTGNEDKVLILKSPLVLKYEEEIVMDNFRILDIDPLVISSSNVIKNLSGVLAVNNQSIKEVKAIASVNYKNAILNLGDYSLSDVDLFFESKDSTSKLAKGEIPVLEEVTWE